MKNNIKTFVSIIVFSIFSATTFASNAPTDEDLATFTDPAAMPGDPGMTPINNYLLPMLVFGILYGFRFLRIKTKRVN